MATKKANRAVGYARVFGQDADGKAILEELNNIYYHRLSYQTGDEALEIAYKEGQRSVIAFINRKTNREDE